MARRTASDAPRGAGLARLALALASLAAPHALQACEPGPFSPQPLLALVAAAPLIAEATFIAPPDYATQSARATVHRWLKGRGAQTIEVQGVTLSTCSARPQPGRRSVVFLAPAGDGVRLHAVDPYSELRDATPALVGEVRAIVAAQAGMTPGARAPWITLELALQAAREYLRGLRVDLSGHFVESVSVQRGDGDPRWVLVWSLREWTKGGAIMVRVHADGRVDHALGE